jgi:catechol 2,3-dioxygenase-like lactoylglutathione lyase family enzyme
MKGLKLIRTSNWEAMVAFYRDRLGMREHDHDSKDSLHEFADFGTEIHLERVASSAEHELLGALQLYSVDPAGLASHLRRGGLAVDTRTVGGRTELMLTDPDGHVIAIVAATSKA